MNKFELEELVAIRIKEAEVLLNAGCFHGAYYLAGYALECAFKVCIAKQVREFDFPDKQLATQSHTHNLKELLRLALLKQDLDEKEEADTTFEKNWGLVLEWSEASRYDCSIDENQAEALFDAITNQNSGVLTWLKNYF